MSDGARILNANEQGDPHAAEQILPFVTDECANSPLKSRGQMLAPTATMLYASLGDFPRTL